MQYRILSPQQLSIFRTQWCVRRDPHNFYQCSNAHREVNHNILRRNPQITPYSYEKCMHVTFADAKNGVEYSSSCTSGENCPFAHSREEVMYHVHVYKTKFCQEFMRTRTCPRGDICAFAHGEQEQRYPPVMVSGPPPFVQGEPQYGDELPHESEYLDFAELYSMDRMMQKSVGPELTVNAIDPDSASSHTATGVGNTRSSSYENSPNMQPVPPGSMWNMDRAARQGQYPEGVLFPQDMPPGMNMLHPGRPRPPNINTSNRTVVSSKSASAKGTSGQSPVQMPAGASSNPPSGRMGSSQSQDIAVQARLSASAAWPLLASTGGKKVGWNRESEIIGDHITPPDTDDRYSDASGWTVPQANNQSNASQRDIEINNLRLAFVAMSRNDGLNDIVKSHARAIRSMKTIVSATGSQLEVSELVDACQELIDCVKSTKSTSTESSIQTPLRICCLVCNERSPTVIVLPCRHLMLCSICLPQAKQCPQCQAAITDSVEISVS